jgi:hypothetical protein
MNGENRFQWKALFRMPWNPHSLAPPTVDPNLEHLDGITRSAESIKYSILSFEFFIARDGQVREWTRHNGRLAALLAIPAFIIVPIITFMLSQLVLWVVALIAIAGHLIVLPIIALLAASVILVVVSLVKAIFK